MASDQELPDVRTGRLSRILESIRENDFKDLRAEFVAGVAEVQERNVFDEDRVSARREIRQLIAIEVQSERVDEAAS